MKRRTVELFTAGCPCCDEVVKLVKSLACPSCDVQIFDMRSDKAAQGRAGRYGIRSVPAVVIEGRLAECCSGRGVQEASLRAAGLGVTL